MEEPISGVARALGAASAPAAEAEQARDHEQAGARLGDTHEAKAEVIALTSGAVVVAICCEEALIGNEPSATDSSGWMRTVGELESVGPLCDVAALVERAVRTRRTGIAPDDCYVSVAVVVGGGRSDRPAAVRTVGAWPGAAQLVGSFEPAG